MRRVAEGCDPARIPRSPLDFEVREPLLDHPRDRVARHRIGVIELDAHAEGQVGSLQIAGWLGRFYEQMPHWQFFAMHAAMCLVGALLLTVLGPVLRRSMDRLDAAAALP